MTLGMLLEKIDSLYDWYSLGTHGSSERFNDGRLSALSELKDFTRCQCSGCGFSLSACLQAVKVAGALACCPDCKHEEKQEAS